MNLTRFKLIILHYHLRPGGVRRIIELATPHILREGPQPAGEVLLAAGEPPPPGWRAHFEEKLAPAPVHFVVEPALRYFSEQTIPPAEISRQLKKALSRLLAGVAARQGVVWAHNLGIGRNLLLTKALAEACEGSGIPLLAHHHDWWFDNRWRYWPEMRRCGFGSLAQVAETILPACPNLCHLTINQSDAALLQSHFGGRSAWLPNLTEPAPPIPAREVRQTHAWLHKHFLPEDALFWLMPARLLRRKNVAEALLLTRWLRPEAWVVTTAGPSSAEEMDYANGLQEAARRHNWPLRIGLLHKPRQDTPTVMQLMAASEAIVMSSIQEGFGLPYIEAAAAAHPLIARALPNVLPDLQRFGFHFPQLYSDILIPPSLFDWSAERKWEQKLFRAWRAQLPPTCRGWAGAPPLLEHAETPHAVPFSRLTLRAQLEILAHPPEFTFSACALLNPFLVAWRGRAQKGELERSLWPMTADRWLSGSAYAKGFWKVARLGQRRPAPGYVDLDSPNATRTQEAFIRQKLAAENLFPLLWASQT